MRKPTAGLTLLLACLVVFALAPAAAAQLPIDPIGSIGDPLGGGTEGSGSPGDGSGGSGSGGGVGSVVDDVEDTLDGDDSSSEPDGTPEGDPKIVEEITNEVNDVVKDPQTTVNETTEDPSGSVGGAIDDTSHAANKDVKDATKGLTAKGGHARKDHRSSTGAGRLAAAAAYHDEVFAKSLAARQADTKNRAPSILASGMVSTVDAAGSGVIQQIGRVAAEAAQQAAFPLLLTLLVVAFLVGQNRIDSRDPKLALAPIDSDQDLLSFT